MTLVKMDYSLLPLYTPSEPSPLYSCEPACDERRLQHTPRVVHPTPSGTYIQKSGSVTVTLFDQEANIKTPTYGRKGFINGAVYLENCERVSQIVMNVDGKVETLISEGGSKSTTLISRCCTLWGRKSNDGVCPGFLSFTCVLPSTYTNGDTERPLPPSYELNHPGVLCMFVKCQYSISIVITRTRHRKWDFLTSTKTVKVPFTYAPRTRAHRPIIPTHCFFSDLKILPEEWYQVSTIIQPRSVSQLEPVNCNFFIPGSRVYGLRDKIPFHIQLGGPLASLREFLSDNMFNPLPTKKSASQSKSIIKVTLVRQTQVERPGQKVWRTTTLGEGEIWETPPGASSICEPKDTAHLDWEGEVRCGEDVSMGGFQAANVIVKDFIVCSIDPPAHENGTSQFLTIQMSVPVRFVTDSWTEVTDYEPPAT